MSISPAVANILILLGVIQGGILSLVVFFSRHAARATRLFLCLFLLVLVYNGVETLNWSTHLNHWFFDVCGYSLIWALGPSFYLYVRSFDGSDPIRFAQAKWHYAPAVAKLLLNWIILGWAVTHRELSKLGTPSFDSVWFAYTDTAEWISVGLAIGYGWLAWRKLRSLKPDNRPEWKLQHRWLKRFVWVYVVFGVFWLGTVVHLQVWGNFNPTIYYPIELGIVLMIYWIGFGSYHHIRVINAEVAKTSTFLDDFSEETITACQEAIHQAMTTDRLYLNPTLSLTDLAKHTKFSPKLISAVMNQRLQKSFPDVVNEYRVHEVKQRLLQRDYQHMTIAGIALESGFNSQATFQRVFKNYTQQTPKEFIQTIKNTSQNPI